MVETVSVSFICLFMRLGKLVEMYLKHFHFHRGSTLVSDVFSPKMYDI